MPAIMSCTGAASSRRWVSKIQILTASHSGRWWTHPVQHRQCVYWKAHTVNQLSTAMKGNNYLLKTVPNLSLFLFSVLALLLCSLQETYEAKRKEFLGDLQRKEEEMRQMFVNKVKETEAELKDKEREVSLEKPSCRLFDSQLHLTCPHINFRCFFVRRSEILCTQFCMASVKPVEFSTF